MNEWCIHIALYCVLLYTQSALQSCGGGGSPLNHHQCAASTWMIRRLLKDNGTSALTTHQLQVERRESHRANQCMLSPHTSYRWRGERVIDPIKCMLSLHTSYRWRGERVIEPIEWMGIIRRPWLIRASGGNLARTPWLHPYSLREVPWDF